MFKEGYISVHVFLNVTTDGRRYYDTVIYRKIKKPGGHVHARGTNLKPEDLQILIGLLQEAQDYLDAELSGESLAC